MNGAALIEKATFVTERAWEYASSSTSVFNKARSLVAGDAQFFSVAPRVDDLRRGLNSASLPDKRDAMKRIVAQMCKGGDMRHFFPDVVKNIHVPSIELRKLIYIFIVYYAEDCPNETLLSISAFQKDLLDSSMHVRALALRMLASLRIPAIQPVVMVAVKKCAADVAPVVRKTAALSLVQMYTVAGEELDREGVRQLLRTLFSDRNADVAGAAAVAYTHICPDEWELIHPVYRRLCRILKECEEWCQVILLRLLLRYARLHFTDPNALATSRAACHSDDDSSNIKGNVSGSDSDDSNASSSSDSSADEKLSAHRRGCSAVTKKDVRIDPDLLLLLNVTRPLLWSINNAVVLAAVALLCHCGTRQYQEACVKSIMRVLCTCTEGHIAVLHVVYALLQNQREAFLPYIDRFFLLPLEPADVRQVKLNILAKLVTSATAAGVYREFRAYLQQWSDVAVVEAMQGLAQVTQHYPPFAAHTIRLLAPLLSRPSSSPAVITEAVSLLRVLVLQGTDPVRISRLVCRLTLDIMEERITEPSAVATILWLAGENISRHPSIAAAAPDCFRVFVKRFGTLESEVKRQTLTLGCKIWVHLQGNSELVERFKRVYSYVAELALYDDDYTVRDEERFLRATFDRAGAAFTAVRAALLREKSTPDVGDLYADREGLELGTLSHLLGPSIRGCKPVPSWATQPSDAALRRSIEEMSSTTAAGAMFDSAFSSSSSSSSPPSSENESESDPESYASSDEEESIRDSEASSRAPDDSTNAKPDGAEDGSEDATLDSDGSSDVAVSSSAARAGLEGRSRNAFPPNKSSVSPEAAAVTITVQYSSPPAGGAP